MVDEKCMKLLAALDNIKLTYDAFNWANRGSAGWTHRKDFGLLCGSLENEEAKGMLVWIALEYDYAYADDYDENKNKNVFGYLRYLINQQYGEKVNEPYGAVWTNEGLMLSQTK